MRLHESAVDIEGLRTQTCNEILAGIFEAQIQHYVNFLPKLPPRLSVLNQLGETVQGHPGTSKMLHELRIRYYPRNMVEKVRHLVDNYTMCTGVTTKTQDQRSKKSTTLATEKKTILK